MRRALHVNIRRGVARTWLRLVGYNPWGVIDNNILEFSKNRSLHAFWVTFIGQYLSNSSMQQRPPSARTRAPASSTHSPADTKYETECNLLRWLHEMPEQWNLELRKNNKRGLSTFSLARSLVNISWKQLCKAKCLGTSVFHGGNCEPGTCASQSGGKNWAMAQFDSILQELWLPGTCRRWSGTIEYCHILTAGRELDLTSQSGIPMGDRLNSRTFWSPFQRIGKNRNKPGSPTRSRCDSPRTLPPEEFTRCTPPINVRATGMPLQ